MKATILAGAIAALMYGTAALAEDCPPAKDTQASAGLAGDQVAQGGSGVAGSQDEGSTVIESSPVQGMDQSQQDLAIGGSGSKVDQGSSSLNQGQGSSSLNQGQSDSSLNQGQAGSMGVDQGFGGSGKAGKGDVVLRCTPMEQGTGGSGGDAWQGGSGSYNQGGSGSFNQGSGSYNQGGSGSYGQDIGGSGLSQPPASAPISDPQSGMTPPDSDPFATTPPVDDADEGGNKNDMRGLTVLLGGGIEGYTQGLAPHINPGVAVGVTAAFKPSSVLGLELGYSGAINNLDDTGRAEGAVSGPDIVRNGGHAVATLGLAASPVQPYILGGIGLSRYNVRGGFSEGFQDDTVGNVPVGAGLRTHIGDFTADARVNYNFLFDQEFATGVATTGVGAPGDSNFSNAGRYSGTLNLGVTF